MPPEPEVFYRFTTVMRRNRSRIPMFSYCAATCDLRESLRYACQPFGAGAIVNSEGGNMTDITEMGPVDYLVIEWTGKQPDGSALPHLIDLVDKGIVRIIDMVFVAKAESGEFAVVEVNELGATFAEFDGVRSGVIGDDDIEEAMSAVEPGTSAAILVWENRWAAPFATALRKNGAQLVATGRIPVQALVAAFEAEATV